MIFLEGGFLLYFFFNSFSLFFSPLIMSTRQMKAFGRGKVGGEGMRKKS